MAIRTKHDASRVLADASGDKRFFCHDGCIAQNLYQLAECLDRISQDAFQHHVTKMKNDFSNWVRDVLGDDKLANELSRCTSSIQASKAVRDRITWLQNKLK